MKVIGKKERFAPFLVPAILGFLFPALFLAVLRIDILDLRHQLAVEHERERALLEDKDRLTVLLEEQHDVKRLQSIAMKRGFVAPQYVIDLNTQKREASAMR